MPVSLQERTVTRIRFLLVCTQKKSNSVRFDSCSLDLFPVLSCSLLAVRLEHYSLGLSAKPFTKGNK